MSLQDKTKQDYLNGFTEGDWHYQLESVMQKVFVATRQDFEGDVSSIISSDLNDLKKQVDEYDLENPLQVEDKKR